MGQQGCAGGGFIDLMALGVRVRSTWPWGHPMKLGSTAMMMTLALTPTVGMAATAPPKAPAPVAAPALSQFDQGVAAYSRGDFTTALRLWRPLADQGNAAAQYNLALMYAKGQGVPQDYAAAVSWYRKAADQGNAAAQGNLGFMYSNGQGVPLDYVQAHKWYNLGSARATEAEVRENNAKNRDNVAALMTPAQIAEAQRLASAWKPSQ